MQNKLLYQKPVDGDKKINHIWCCFCLFVVVVLFTWSQIRVLVILVTYRQIILYLRWRMVYILTTKSTINASATHTALFGHQFRV